MNTGIRIPTLLGIGVLLVGLFGGVFLVSQNQLSIFQTKASKSSEPKKITLANLSGNSASIYWQTDESSPGFIEAGDSPSLGLTFNDDRDIGAPQTHQLHFVTLNNLTPDTTYYYKIVSGSSSFPLDNPLTFKTLSTTETSPTPPLIGQIVDVNLQPISEALINLSIPGTSNLATITKLSGNFILPLTNLSNLENTSTTLIVFNGEKSSKINLKLPYPQTTLPQIILGQDIDLSASESTNSSPLTVKYDLNNDGVVNALDAGIVFGNFGKKGKNILGDLNKDGIVDQKDIDLLNKVSN
ncbi:MAG: fibronectin type III domain-containing protein [Candidatus Daviesbacteria bacterium]|nr:fibronectin type III domain-containing protein [Candidatus Daviesbacteria bacterium]